MSTTRNTIQQVRPHESVQPQSTQQAWDMFSLMFREVVAEAECVLSEWDGQTSTEEKHAKDMLSRDSQDYIKKYGVLNVPLCVTGSDKLSREIAKQTVLKRLRNDF